MPDVTCRYCGMGVAFSFQGQHEVECDENPKNPKKVIADELPNKRILFSDAEMKEFERKSDIMQRATERGDHEYKTWNF